MIHYKLPEVVPIGPPRTLVTMPRLLRKDDEWWKVAISKRDIVIRLHRNKPNVMVIYSRVR